MPTTTGSGPVILPSSHSARSRRLHRPDGRRGRPQPKNVLKPLSPGGSGGRPGERGWGVRDSPEGAAVSGLQSDKVEPISCAIYLQNPFVIPKRFPSHPFG